MASFLDATSTANLWAAQRIAVEVEAVDGSRLSILVDKPFARVGRDQRSEVPLSDGRLFPCHLYLHATDEGLYYVGLTPDSPSGWLLPSESVQVGPFQLRARVVDAEPSGSRPSDLQAKQSDSPLVPQLRVFSGGRSARSTDLRLRRLLTLLGREPPATRRVNHPSISRVHCAIFFDDRGLWLVDLFSSNGTRLAGKRFDSGPLSPGQEFKLGSVRFHYVGTQANPKSEAESSALEQPVVIVDHSDEVDRHDSGTRVPVRQEGDWTLAESLRKQHARLEQDRHEFRHRLEERVAAIREELVQEVAALRQESQRAGLAFQSLSSEVATTREALFARYAEVGPKLAEDAGLAERVDETRRQIAAALQEAETRWADLAQDLSRRATELHRQVDDAQESQNVLARSLKLREEEAQRRLRKERRAHRKRLAAAKHKFAAELAGLQVQTQAVRQDLRSLQAATQGQAAGAESSTELPTEAVKRQADALLSVEARWNELADGFERRALELARQVADCRQADAQMAESFQGALREAARQLQTQHQAHLEVAAIQDELLSGSSTLAQQITALREELERHAADFAPLKQTLAVVQPTLTRLQTGEWAADLQRSWQAHLEKAIDEVRKRVEDTTRQSALDRQATSDRVAGLEGALAAQIADLRVGLHQLRETTEERRGGLISIGAGDEMARKQTAGPLPVGPSSHSSPSGIATPNAETPHPIRVYEDAESAAPPWVINDQVTDRLLEFKTSREQLVRRNRLLWTAVAAGLVAIVVSGAGIVHIWLSNGEPLKQSEAASLEQSRLLAR